MRDEESWKLRVTLTNTWINKLKSAASNNTCLTLKITNKIFEDGEFPHKLLLTIR